MDNVFDVVEKCVRMSTERAGRLNRLAQIHGISEDQIVEKALDILSDLTDLFDERAERAGWTALSEGSLQRVWDNAEDAAYDNWPNMWYNRGHVG